MRCLHVLMGTSLFSSASWSEVPGLPAYDRWTEGDCLKNPGLRRSGSFGSPAVSEGEIQKEIEERLLASPEALDEFATARTCEPRRYSAEMTTILRLAEVESGGAISDESTRRFLSKFKSVTIWIPEDPRDKSHVAGIALVAILQAFGVSSERIQHVEFGGEKILEKLHCLNKSWSSRFDPHHPENADGKVHTVIATGGYKAYGQLLGVVASKTARLLPSRPPIVEAVYLHEDHLGDLVRWDGLTFRVGQDSLPLEPGLPGLQA